MNTNYSIDTRIRTFLGVALAGILLAGSTATAQAQATNAPATAKTAPDSDDDWHVNATLYLWFPGVHGNLSALGYNLGYKASPGDLLKHANFGVMGLVGVRYKRLVFMEDLLYTPLTVEKTTVFQLPTDPTLSAKMKHTQFMLTPEVGVRIIDGKIKVDGLAGFRYWHLGNTLTITPAPPLLASTSTSKHWADPLLGARIQLPLSSKLTFTLMGDVGPFGTGAHLDYQIAPVLSYKFKRKWAMDVAWRYLYLDYKETFFNSQMAMSGIVFGTTYSIN